MEKQLAKSKITVNSKLKDKTGGVQVILIASIFFFVCSVIFVMSFEINRNMAITTKVQNTISDGITYTARNNLINSYDTIRQGNSGAYSFQGNNSFSEINDLSGFKKSLAEIYNLYDNGRSLEKRIDGHTIWEISNFNLKVYNANHDNLSEYVITYDLIIPHQFLWKDKPSLYVSHQKQNVQYKTRN